MKRRHELLVCFCVALVAVALFPGVAGAFTIDDFDTASDPASALLFDFAVVGPGNSSQADLDLLDLGMAVTVDGNQMLFEFINVSPISSVIAKIYFDDGGDSLIGNGQVLSPQVNGVLRFSIGGGAPPNLPGGNGIGFSSNSTLTANAFNPTPQNGVGPGERLILGYDALADPSAVGQALLDGSLRVGLHVRSIGDSGDSDAFVSVPFDFPPEPQEPQNPVPEPSTLILLGMGTSFLVARKRRLL